MCIDMRIDMCTEMYMDHASPSDARVLGSVDGSCADVDGSDAESVWPDVDGLRRGVDGVTAVDGLVPDVAGAKPATCHDTPRSPKSAGTVDVYINMRVDMCVDMCAEIGKTSE